MTIQFLRYASTQAAEQYFTEFVNTIDHRLSGFRQLVSSSGGVGDLDLSFASLDSLAIWLKSNVELRQMNAAEVDALRRSPIGYLKPDLTTPLLSEEWKKRSIDIGTYFGCVFTRSSETLVWRMSRQGERGFNHHQPVVSSTSGLEMPALAMMGTFMLGLPRYPNAVSRLRSVTQFWTESFGLAASI